MNGWKPGPATLHGCLTSNFAQTFFVLCGTRIIPLHNRTTCRRERNDFINSQLGEFLHNHFRLFTLHGCESNREHVLPRSGFKYFAQWVNLTISIQLCRNPTASAIADGHDVVLGDTQNLQQMVCIFLFKFRRCQRTNKHMCSRFAQHVDHENADFIFDLSPPS